MWTRIKNEAKLLGVSFAIGATLALVVGAFTFVYSDVAQREIADNVLRFHVIAHSNDAYEQALKEQVRTAVLDELENNLSAGISLDTARNYVFNRLHDIERTAQAAVHQAGFDHLVSAEITSRFFPTTIYGDITFPPGAYETLTLSIGDGVGRNWWCLMFPPLCYVEMTGTPQTRGLLEENIPAPGFALLTHRQEDAPTTVAVRFRIVEWWQNRRAPATLPPNLQHAQR